MAIPSLSNWVELSERGISGVITKVSPGVYVLGPKGDQGGVFAHYVGRSDVDLAARLRQHIGKYTHFVYAYMPSPTAAFSAECEMYHHFRPNGNTIHPARPTNTNWHCPVSGCTVL